MHSTHTLHALTHPFPLPLPLPLPAANSSQPPATDRLVKAVPSASPLVTPEMGERLCRMASQHYMSDYNRYKRGLHPNPIHQTYASDFHSQQLDAKSAKPNRTPFPYAFHHPPPTLQTVVTPQAIAEDINLNKPQIPIPEPPNNTVAVNPKSERTPQSNRSIEINSTANNSAEKRKFRSRSPSPAHDQQPNGSSIANTASKTAVVVDSNQVSVWIEQQPKQQQQQAVARSDMAVVKTSETHPMNISPVVPPELSIALADFCLHFPTDQPSSPQNQTVIPVDLYDLTGLNSHQAYETFQTYYQKRQLDYKSLGSGTRKLGNMLLSSCPGKKVRMSSVPQPQTVGSRSPICRDLKSDLIRAKSLGIRAIICCLDDEELHFLGSPWQDYLNVSKEIGLQVLRLPMAEGYAPFKGVEEIDEVLRNVLENFTFAGLDVLCHCRGGVGRAGLVACCWMLKIGLINKPFIESSSNGVEQTLDSSIVTNGLTQQQVVPRASVLGQVEKVIEVIRRRRSVKAIETPQQVHFIMEYASWLDNQSSPPP